MLGVALGLYAPLSKRLLGCILAFASGGLISAMAIELAFNGALQLHHLGFGRAAAWSFVDSGFARVSCTDDLRPAIWRLPPATA
jgi:hypothetical protein